MDEYHGGGGEKETNNETTYKFVKAVKPVIAPFAMLVIPLPYKFLYVQIWGE